MIVEISTYAQTGSPNHNEPAFEPQRESEAPAPLSTAARSVPLTIIAVLVVFTTLYFVASLLVAIAASVLLSMLLAPGVQILERLHVPRMRVEPLDPIAEFLTI